MTDPQEESAGGPRAAPSPLSELTSSDTLTGAALVRAMGGIRGIIEAVLPGLLFLVGFTLYHQLVPAVIAACVVGVGFTAVRLFQRQSALQSLAGLAATLLSAALALINGRPTDFYLVGLWTNAAYFAALLLSVIVRWPLIGVVVGVLTGEGMTWRRERAVRRVYTLTTLLWSLLFALRLAVQVPLYVMGSVAALGTVHIVMGIPLYAPLLVVTWLIVRATRSASSKRSGGAGA